MGAHDLQTEHRAKPLGRRPAPPCELCQQRACVYCPWDEAKLCDLCDEKVHSANFLVARHTRHLLCPCCGIPTFRPPITGSRIQFTPLLQGLPCMQCRSQVAGALKEQDGDRGSPSTAESCCIDADEDRSSSVASADSRSQPFMGESRAMRKRNSASASAKCNSRPCAGRAGTVLDVQEEGLGDSEDCGYGVASPQKPPARKRRRCHRR